MKSVLRPRISVVIPCLNEANYIGFALESIANQDFDKPFEVIVVDNNCTDDTVKIAKSFGAKIVTEKTPGVCDARQAGTNAATGEIIVSTDADTVFQPNWLSNIDAHFVNNKNVVGVAGSCHYVDAPFWARAYQVGLFNLVNFGYKTFKRAFYGSATNIAFKKSAWTGYDLNLTQGGDELGLLHSLRKKGKVVFDKGTPTMTSSRRLTRGMFYNIFVSLFYYYFMAYYLNKIFKRQILGSAPTYRSEKPEGLVPNIAYRTKSFRSALSISLKSLL